MWAPYLNHSASYSVDTDDRSGDYSCIFLPEPVGRGDIHVDGKLGSQEVAVRGQGSLQAWAAGSRLILTGPPRIKAGKKSEHSSEGESVRLVCKSELSRPPVTQWTWLKTSDSGDQVRALWDMRLQR